MTFCLLLCLSIELTSLKCYYMYRHTTTLDIHILTTFSPMGATALGGRLEGKSGMFQSRGKGLGSKLCCHFFYIRTKITGWSTTNTRNTPLLIPALIFNKFRLFPYVFDANRYELREGPDVSSIVKLGFASGNLLKVLFVWLTDSIAMCRLTLQIPIGEWGLKTTFADDWRRFYIL